MIELRPYQVEAIDRLRQSYASGSRAPLFQLPTGGGKTVIFGAVTHSAWSRGRRVLIAVHRRELIHQASNKLDWAGVPHGVIAAGFRPAPEIPVQVCSVQTVIRRLETIGLFDLVVFDEAHHCRAESWQRLIDAQPQARLLGVTATPARLDGQGLGIHCGGCFDDLVCGPSIKALVDGGYLSPVRYFIPQQQRVDLTGVRTRGGDYVASELAARIDHKAVTGDAVEQYRQRADHQPAIAFCATVSHAEHVAEEFREAGYRSEYVHGELPKPGRDRLIAGLGNGEIEVLTSCDLISEGLDVPALGAVILLRPTKSLVLHYQQIGRGMRPAPGKTLIVLDHAGNIVRHGRPDFERLWTLDGVEEACAPMRICPECGAVNPIDALECEACGYEFPRGAGGGRRAPDEVPGYLAELSADRLAALLAMPYRQIVSIRLSEVELRAYARLRGYKKGWVWHRLQERRERPS